MDRKLKEYMKSNGLLVQKNTAYGELMGYAATLFKEKGYVQIHIATYFQDIKMQHEFEDSLDRKLLSREHRLLDLKFLPDQICATISYHSPKDMLKLKAFVEYFFPLLIRYGTVHSNDSTPLSIEKKTLYKTA